MRKKTNNTNFSKINIYWKQTQHAAWLKFYTMYLTIKYHKQKNSTSESWNDVLCITLSAVSTRTTCIVSPLVSTCGSSDLHLHLRLIFRENDGSCCQNIKEQWKPADSLYSATVPWQSHKINTTSYLSVEWVIYIYLYKKIPEKNVPSNLFLHIYRYK